MHAARACGHGGNSRRVDGQSAQPELPAGVRQRHDVPLGEHDAGRRTDDAKAKRERAAAVGLTRHQHADTDAHEPARGGALTLGLGVVGASAGVVLTERYIMPLADAGRQFGLGRLTIDPAGLAAVATRARGTHSLVRFTF